MYRKDQASEKTTYSSPLVIQTTWGEGWSRLLRHPDHWG